jgi:hypothetical protein
MEVLPDSLDTVVVRAVWGQKVKLHLIAPSQLSSSDCLAAMDFEVVQNEMDTPFSTIGMTERIDQGDEESACFPWTLDPKQTARAGIERPRQVMLLILPGRHDFLLLS